MDPRSCDARTKLCPFVRERRLKCTTRTRWGADDRGTAVVAGRDVHESTPMKDSRAETEATMPLCEWDYTRSPFELSPTIS